MMTIALDSSPVGLLVLPGYSAEALACEEWVERMVDAGYKIAIPEVIVYEIRRELLRLGKRKSLARLADLTSRFIFLPLDSVTMDKAAEFWAESRRRGRPTAGEKALDIDVILRRHCHHEYEAPQSIRSRRALERHSRVLNRSQRVE